MTRLVACSAAAVLLGACGGPLTKEANNARVYVPPTSTTRPAAKAHPAGPSNATVESDLRNALTAEKTIFTDQQVYVAAPATMQTIEPTLKWGHELQTTVGDAQTPGDAYVVCLTETSAAGVKFAIADIADGPLAGTYYGRNGCPAPLTPTAVANLGS